MDFAVNLDNSAISCVAVSAINDVKIFFKFKNIKRTKDRSNVVEKFSKALELITGISAVGRFSSYDDRNCLRLAYKIVIDSLENGEKRLNICLVQSFVKDILKISLD